MSVGSTELAELLLHPVRLRVIQAIAGRRVTVQELKTSVPGVPHATLYRHVNRLIDGGVLSVVEERRVRGTTERTLALVDEHAVVGPADAAKAAPADLFRWYATFLVTQLTEFAGYLEREDHDLLADGVGFRTVPLHLDDEEFAQFTATLADLLGRAHANEPTDERTRRVFAFSVMPAAG